MSSPIPVHNPLYVIIYLPPAPCLTLDSNSLKSLQHLSALYLGPYRISSAFFFFLFLAQDLSSPTGVEPAPLAVKTWSPNHWTAREFPAAALLKEGFLCDVGFAFLGWPDHLYFSGTGSPGSQETPRCQAMWRSRTGLGPGWRLLCPGLSPCHALQLSPGSVNLTPPSCL